MRFNWLNDGNSLRWSANGYGGGQHVGREYCARMNAAVRMMVCEGCVLLLLSDMAHLVMQCADSNQKDKWQCLKGWFVIQSAGVETLEVANGFAASFELIPKGIPIC